MTAIGEPPRRVRWTREKVEALQRQGFLAAERRYEVIDGEIIEMSENPPHRSAVRLLYLFLVRVFGIEVTCCQSAITASIGDPARNNPIPDVSVTQESDAAYFGRFPGPDDLIFIGEVSDSSLAYDLNDKAALYSRASIPEYWVLDITGRRLIVHRMPCETGYAEVRTYTENDETSALSRPDAKVRVAELLPPATETEASTDLS